MTVESRVAAHYARDDLKSVILEALRGAGHDLDRLQVEDLAAFDEFHVRGRAATAELGRALGLEASQVVLDVGSGLGGPSRHLVTNHGCRIVGVDLSPDYCEAATMLAERVGLAERVEYRAASALAMPFDDHSFDHAYTQHVAMNIEDKASLYREVARVLKPGGSLGIYDICKGPGDEVLFPTPWARDPATSFVVPPEAVEAALGSAGFVIRSVRDTSEAGIAWYAAVRERLHKEGPAALGFNVMFGPAFKEMGRNVHQNLIDGRIVLTEIIAYKPS